MINCLITAYIKMLDVNPCVLTLGVQWITDGSLSHGLAHTCIPPLPERTSHVHHFNQLSVHTECNFCIKFTYPIFVLTSVKVAASRLQVSKCQALPHVGGASVKKSF